MEKNINEDYGVLVNISLAEQVAEQEKAIAELVEALEERMTYIPNADMDDSHNDLIAKHKPHTKEEG